MAATREAASESSDHLAARLALAAVLCGRKSWGLSVDLHHPCPYHDRCDLGATAIIAYSGGRLKEAWKSVARRLTGSTAASTTPGRTRPDTLTKVPPRAVSGTA
jgi:hypothetical protein